MKTMYVCIALCSVIVLGCGSAYNVSTVKDPFYKSWPVRNIMVTTSFERLTRQDSVEEIAVEEFTDAKLRALRGNKVLPTIRTYSDAQKQEIYAQNNIQGILKISIGDIRHSFEQYPTTTQRTKKRNIDSVYNKATKTTKYDTTYTDEVSHTQAYSAIEVQDVTVVATMYSPADTNVIWKAEAVVPYRQTFRTERNNPNVVKNINPTFTKSTWGSIIESFIEKGVADGVLAK